MHYQDNMNNQWYSSEAPSGPDVGYSNSYNYGNYSNGYVDTGLMSSTEEDYDNEAPLLEELGVRFDHIWAKTQAVIHPLRVRAYSAGIAAKCHDDVPFKALEEHILDDADLAGPVFFCLLMGSFLLLSGKVHFGYIYGFSVFGCLGMNGLLNLVSERGLDFWLTCSVLGYCLLPVICLAGLAVLLRLRNVWGALLSVVAIAWSTHAATR